MIEEYRVDERTALFGLVSQDRECISGTARSYCPYVECVRLLSSCSPCIPSVFGRAKVYACILSHHKCASIYGGRFVWFEIFLLDLDY
jgi:hypothetical protein